MRRLSLLLFVVLTLGGGGCGKNGAADPANLTAEQIEAANKEQKKANDAERAHQKANPGNKKGSANDKSVDEEERRARGGR
jgi:hypothetical protein